MTTTTTPPGGGQAWEHASVAAGNYQRDLVPALFQPWARELVALARLRPGERILDVACGTGIVARTAAPLVGETGTVTGLDVNQDMLAIARQVDEAGAGPAIEWRQASAANTGLPDAAYDAVFCQQGFQFFGDRPAAAQELHRVTAPGGRLLVSVWCDPDNPAYAPCAAALERHLPGLPAAAGFVKAIFSLHDTRELHALLAGAGFREVRVEQRTSTVRFATARAWTAAFLDATPIPGIATVAGSTRARIIEEAAEALAGYVDGDLVYPMRANVAVARCSPG